MSYLVRKIERTKWIGCDTANSSIRAELVLQCVKPNHNQLSVWHAATQEDVDLAVTAMLAASNKIDTIDYVVFPSADVQAAGLKLVVNPAPDGPQAFRQLHRDIDHLDVDSLAAAAKVIQMPIIAKKAVKLTQGQCKEKLRAAIANGLFPVTELHPDIVRKLNLPAATV